MLITYNWFAQSRFAASWVLEKADYMTTALSSHLNATQKPLDASFAKTFLFQHLIPELLFIENTFALENDKSIPFIQTDIPSRPTPDVLNVPPNIGIFDSAIINPDDTLSIEHIPKEELGDVLPGAGATVEAFPFEGLPQEEFGDLLPVPKTEFFPEPESSLIDESMLAITDAAGNFLASTHEQKNISYPEKIRFSSQKSQLVKDGDYIYAQSPINTLSHKVTGWIILRYPKESVRLVVSDIANNLLIFAAGLSFIAIILSALAGTYLSKRFGRRISDLQIASTALSQGKFDVSIDVNGKDEISLLATSFTTMAEKLKAQMMKLRNLAEYNEQLVLEKESLARAEERNHLARELHDAVKQQIFALHLSMGSLLSRKNIEAEQIRANLEELAKLSHNILLEMDHIIRELRPASLEDRGLVAALADYVQEFEELRGIKTSFSADGTYNLSVAQEQCLYRVAQEALNNVFKHALASKVEITLEYSLDMVTLLVKDNGCGFNTQLLERKSKSIHDMNIQGMGIQGMQNRLVALGGKFTIKSDNNKGTIVTAYLPTNRTEAS